MVDGHGRSRSAIRSRAALRRPAWVPAMLIAAAAAFAAISPRAQAAGLATAVVVSAPGDGAESYDGVVEAVRQAVVSAQVPGTIVAIQVKAGDRVKAGQVLVRIDARAAEQDAAASEAQVRAARAALDVARRQVARQRELFRSNYISQAAMDRAEAQFRATQAQVDAQLAQAGAARTQSGFYIVKAPYAGVVSAVPVTVGDMAMPGRALLTIYDPAMLRVSAAVPQSAAEAVVPGGSIAVDLPGLPDSAPHLAAHRVEVLPAADPGTHTVDVRAYLPHRLAGVVPGTFARLWLPAPAGAPTRIFVPASAVVVRAEMTGLYVLDAKGDPLLRQVRLGRRDGDRVEVLAGVSAGERIALDPQAAARVR